MDRLFAYGTLLAPELRYAIIRRNIDGTPARLKDYVCLRVRRAAYPAIMRRRNAITEGELFCGISDHEWDLLDEFESNLYRRTRVRVNVGDGDPLDADTYVIDRASEQRLSDEAWDYEAFRRTQLERYLRHL